ncbi:hypothetical protein [Caballeronia sp. GAWG1-5s-s]|uniref:hypothetical protein n=1 Tax=Caballeronia sp. GAWG1-5s-s TaxID=2921743 RepID=UPI002029054F|nr:hypothetical protein [Caballeronia sp. GAWG1-5s-s]
MLAHPSPKQWSLARRASCSPACLASVCASLSIIPLAFATAMHAMNGSIVWPWRTGATRASKSYAACSN